MPSTTHTPAPDAGSPLPLKIGILLAAAACIALAVIGMMPYHWGLPAGCDEFGYLYQAEAVRSGRLFSEHTERPFLKPLVTDLAATCERDTDYMWMVTPHAYHYVCDSGRVANQYPPGTALVLAAFPKELRAYAYPGAVTAMLMLLIGFAWSEGGWKLAATAGVVVCAAIGALVLHPFVNEYRHVGSVALTFAPLIAAGWLLRRRPLAAVALASFTVIFRISNVWLLPVVALPYVFSEYFGGGTQPGWKILFMRATKAIGVALVCGAAWILLYQWALLGSPLRSTYSFVDREGADAAGMLANARFYFNPLVRNWFDVHLAALVLIAVFFRGGKRRWLWFALLLAAWNYAFFIAHKVATPYYTCASALVLAGLLFSRIDELEERRLKVLAAASAALSLLLAGAVLLNTSKPPLSFAEQVARYEKSLGGANIVWAEYSSGTVEYALGIPTMRLNWGTAKSVNEATRWLSAHGYRQAVLLDDDGIDAGQALAALDKSGLRYEVRRDEHLGRIAWIDAGGNSAATR
jgi:hypothetical protein